MIEAADLATLGEVESIEGLKVRLRVPRAQIKDAAAWALAHWPVADVTVEEPPVESIIREVFQAGSAAHA